MTRENTLRTIQKAGEALYFQDLDNHSKIDVDCDEKTMRVLLDHIEAAWTMLGNAEPHWSVLTNPRYVSDRITEKLEAEFYDTGAVEVQAWSRAFSRNGLSLATSGSLLDFGCGIGRLAEHMAPLVGAYVGADVSLAHLSLARARTAANEAHAIEFVHLPDLLASGRRFARIGSCLVLQHNPPPVMRHLLEILLRMLEPGGCALIQLPVRLFDGYAFDLAHYLSECVGKPPRMETHALPQRHVFAAAARAGCAVMEAFPDGRIGEAGLSYTFVFERPASIP